METILKSLIKEYKITTNQFLLVLRTGMRISCVNINPAQLTQVIRAPDLLLGQDVSTPRICINFCKLQFLGIVANGTPTKA